MTNHFQAQFETDMGIHEKAQREKIIQTLHEVVRYDHRAQVALHRNLLPEVPMRVATRAIAKQFRAALAMLDSHDLQTLVIWVRNRVN
jgi:hypothetical protein